MNIVKKKEGRGLTRNKMNKRGLGDFSHYQIKKIEKNIWG